MNKLLLLLPLMFLAGCDGQLYLNTAFDDFQITLTSQTVFDCEQDAIQLYCPHGEGKALCNEADGFVYLFDTNALVTNSDTTGVTCDINSFQTFPPGTVLDKPIIQF